MFQWFLCSEQFFYVACAVNVHTLMTSFESCYRPKKCLLFYYYFLIAANETKIFISKEAGRFLFIFYLNS
jgi:hypothetical protein